MVKYGKEIFQDNVNQLMTITVSLILAIVAQKLAGEIADMSLLAFIKDGYGLFFTNEQLSFIRHVLLPFIMYFLSCAFLLWMGLTNIVTCNERNTRSFIVLKIVLGVVQLLLFSVLLFSSGRLFFYFKILVFTTIILIGILNFAATFHEVGKKHK